jgi:integrase/recombinase XerC
MAAQQPKPLPFDPESTSWLDALHRAGASASTIDCYARDLRDIADAIGSDDLAATAAIDQLTVDRVSALWSAEGAAASTIYRRFAGLRNFARFLGRERSCDCSKFLSCRLPPCGRVRREPIGKESIEMILSSSTFDFDDAWMRVRDCAAIHVAASSALTTAELVGLNRRDFKPALAAVLVRGSHLDVRPAALSHEAARHLSRYLEDVPFDLGPDDPLFVTTRRTRLSARSLQLAFRRCRNLAGVSRTTVPSSLRNEFGFSLARSGAAPEVVAAALGIGVASAWRYFETRKSE